MASVGAAGDGPGALLAIKVESNTSKPVAAQVTPDFAAAERLTRHFFNTQEALFIEPACERLIPQYELGRGALAAGVTYYLDK